MRRRVRVFYKAEDAGGGRTKNPFKFGPKTGIGVRFEWA